MRIAILYASAGHGHFKAAEAIREGLIACGVSEKDMFLLDALDGTPPWFKKAYTSIYYYSVRHTPRTWGQIYALMDQGWFYQSVARGVRRWLNGWIGRGIVRRMAREKPDAILFTHFLAPEVLGHAKTQGVISSFLVTVVTDFLPHRFWVNPGTDHYWVMGEEGQKILERWGVPSQRITAGGIPISLRFRFQGKKREFQKKEGLDEGRFTILLTSGSFGLGPTREVLSIMKEFDNKIQALVVCGNNQDLLNQLEKEGYPFQVKQYGFVSHMDELMEASDLIIAKPGGATTAESLAKGVPMVVMQPIPGQETGNAEVLKERNASFSLKQPSDIRVILKAILDYPGVIEEKKKSMEPLAKPEAALQIAKLVLEKLKR